MHNLFISFFWPWPSQSIEWVVACIRHDSAMLVRQHGGLRQMRGAECVVMAGDPQQLPPTVLSKLAFDCELDRTVFDRLQASICLPLNPTCRIEGLHEAIQEANHASAS